jgi:hypothetical protein
MTKENKPPLFKSWKGWYLAVIIFLVLQIVLFTIITEHFR